MYAAKFAAAVVLCAMALTGCGGGGGGSTAPGAEVPASTDRFAPVRDLVCSGAQDSGWCWQEPQPAAEIVTGVFFLNADIGWAAGTWGWMQKTTDGGKTWSRLPLNEFNFTEIAFADDLNGWALLEFGGVAHTTDGGRSWQRQVVPQPAFLGPAPNKLKAIDARRAVAFTGRFPQYALATDDAGAHWRVALQGDPLYATATGAILGFDGTEGRRTDDMGLSTTALGPLPACSPFLDVQSAPRIWAYCSGPTPDPSDIDLRSVFVSDDGGLTWRDVHASFPVAESRDWMLSEVKLTAQGDGWGLLRDPLYSPDIKLTVLRASNGATRWAPITLPASLEGAVLAPGSLVDAQTLWLVKDGLAYWTQDGGTTWKQLSVPGETSRPAGLERDGGGGLLAAFFEGSAVRNRHFYRSVDGGQTWRRVPGGLDEEVDRYVEIPFPGGVAQVLPSSAVRGLWFFDAARGLALTRDGALMDTSDGGRHWTSRGVTTPAVQPCCIISGRLQFTTSGRGWLIDKGKLMQSSDGGRNWSSAPVPAGMGSVRDLQFMDGQRGWAVTAQGQLFGTTDGGASWTLRPDVPGQKIQMVQFHDEKAGLAWVNDGLRESMWRTADGGTTWQLTSLNGRATTGVGKILFLDASNVWMVGTGHEGVWRSRDGGKFWDAVTVPVATGSATNTIGFYDIHFTDAQYGWIVGGQGTVLATVDGGLTWEKQATGSAALGTFTTMFWLDRQTGWIGGGTGSREDGRSIIMATVTGGR
ncbi:MAG: YCF48-related protein [Ramlibacter sp.]